MFQDRGDAGRQLAVHLVRFAPLRPMVIAMPRGGVPVAFEIARHLGATLDIIGVRKLGVPWQPELGIGAIAEGGIRILNETLIRDVGVGPADVERVTASEAIELERRVRQYRGDRPPPAVEGRVVILVDDGLATGYTARAAIASVRASGATRVILAVPVAPRDSVAAMAGVADDVVVVQTPDAFMGVGQAYRDFAPTTDREVVDGLARGREPRTPPATVAQKSGG